MTPGVSAGSNHVGASETWTANVICPSGGAAAGTDTAGPSAAVRASTATNVSDEWRGFIVSSRDQSCWIAYTVPRGGARPRLRVTEGAAFPDVRRANGTAWVGPRVLGAPVDRQEVDDVSVLSCLRQVDVAQQLGEHGRLLEDRELRDALAVRLGHRVPGQDQDGEEHGEQDARDQRPDVTDLLGEADRELLLRLRPGLVGRVREEAVDRGGDGAGLAGIGDADDVPARLALAELPGLVEVGGADEHDVGVAACRRVLRVQDADQLELPRHAAVGLRVDLGRDGQPLAEPPAVAIDQPPPGHRARARRDEARSFLGR